MALASTSLLAGSVSHVRANETITRSMRP